MSANEKKHSNIHYLYCMSDSLTTSLVEPPITQIQVSHAERFWRGQRFYERHHYTKDWKHHLITGLRGSGFRKLQFPTYSICRSAFFGVVNVVEEELATHLWPLCQEGSFATGPGRVTSLTSAITEIDPDANGVRWRAWETMIIAMLDHLHKKITRMSRWKPSL